MKGKHMAKAAAVETEVEEEGGLRSQMWKHEAMVDWINANDGVDLDTLSAADIIAYAFARRVEWRKSDTYRSLVEEYRQSAAEESAQRKAAAAAAKAERDAAKAAEAKATPAPAKATKTAAKKAAATKATPAPKKATRAKSAASDDSPFD